MPLSCNFQTVRDDTKQSDWPLPGKIAPHLDRIQLFSVASPKTVVYVTMDCLPLKCMGFRMSHCSLRCHGFAPLSSFHTAPTNANILQLTPTFSNSRVSVGRQLVLFGECGRLSGIVGRVQHVQSDRVKLENV